MIKLRNYKDSDYKELSRFLRASGHFNPLKDSKENLRKKIRKDKDSIIVAVEDKKTVGCQYIVYDYWSAFLFRLCVDEKHRNRGIGSMLMREAERRLKKKGIKTVSILVRVTELKKLREHYIKKGYKPAPFKHQIFDKKL